MNLPIDLLTDFSRWLPVVSGRAALAVAGERGALKMGFDFKGEGGFVVARQELAVVLPAEFAVRLKIKGVGAGNHLEVKLADSTGKNVWRFEKKQFPLPKRWQKQELLDHDFEFASGPAGGGQIADLGAVEIAVVAAEGGAGCLWVSEFVIEDRTLNRAPTVKASSGVDGVLADLRELAGWCPQREDDGPWLELEFETPRFIGGLIIDWTESAPGDGFSVKGTSTEKSWRTLRTANRAGGRRSYIMLPGNAWRRLRLELNSPAGVASLRWQHVEFSRSAETFWHQIAALEPRGWLPCWLTRAQSLWTLVGTPDGQPCALINEQGMAEPGVGSFAVEPMVVIDGKLYTWADVEITLSLREGWMPLPVVTWKSVDWQLEIEAFSAELGVAEVRYRVVNHGAEAMKVQIFALVRPFQVTPPWQKFRDLGGVSKITSLTWREGRVKVNGRQGITPSSGAEFGALGFDEGVVVGRLAAGDLPQSKGVKDTSGGATGVVSWSFELSPGSTAEAGWSSGVGGSFPSEAADLWRVKVRADRYQGSGWMNEVIRSALTAGSHVLLTRSGMALQPGARRYTRSWIRDGTIMSACLLRLGCEAEVRGYLEWYAPFQREDGFVPCCVDSTGPDWLVEHDSHGQFIALVADHFRFARDKSFTAALWPQVCKAAAYIERTLEPSDLMPISASHEGYLAQPVHSYWDDFWTLRGLRDAAALSRVFGSEADVERWNAAAERLSAGISQSLEETRREKQLEYIPGSVEWADFDPTATANAITLFDVPVEMNRAAVDWTFDKYLVDWRRKRTGELEWSNYTAYEVRIIGAFVRMGQREKALELLRFFLSDQRPQPWNQWPEITWCDPSWPGHIGDVPHTWIAAEFALAVESLFAYESERQRALVLAAGVAREWTEGAGVYVNALATGFGTLSYSLRSDKNGSLTFELRGALSLPEGGIILRPPLNDAICAVTLNGEPHPDFTAREICFSAVPALVTLHTHPVV
jgi:hypothetical protein